MLTNVEGKFDDYPDEVKTIMLGVRELILCVAQDNQLGAVEKSLKWGEPTL
ncbi:hypothetical protein [Marinomonas primoryensis]|jgi:hypothetical protein|uniref:hypothetical protein n=1 Tax=Marinomonas primoryensis TaxID=178399 RepID=UPI0037049727